MSALINHTYFAGELLIPNWQNNAAIQERIADFVNKYEQSYLDSAMGVEFAELFRAGITSDRFAKLKNGGVFKLSDGSSIRFGGIANGTNFKSPIASLVYYWWQRDVNSASTDSGEVNISPDKATMQSAKVKAVRAWNDMVWETLKLWQILLLSVNDDGSKVYAEFNSDYVDSKMFTTINQFGI